MEFGSASKKTDMDDTTSAPFLMYWVAIIEEMSSEEIQRCHKDTSGSC